VVGCRSCDARRERFVADPSRDPAPSIRDGDSKLLTLIHEVTHFDDTFSSFDTWYGTKNARDHAEDPRSRVNADSIAGYILGVVAKASI